MSNAEKTSLSPHYYKNKKPNTSPKTKHSFITPKQTDFFSNNLSQKTIYSKDLQAHGKELRDKKSRIFDLLDREEELILSQDIDDLKREDLLKEYKVLYYKSKEQKTLLNEFAINNKEYQKELVEKTKKTDELNKELKKMMEELKFKERKHAETKEHFENLNFHNDKKEEEYDKNKRKSKELAEEYEKIKEKLILLQDENKRLKEQQKYSEEIKNFINKKEEKIQVTFNYKII